MEKSERLMQENLAWQKNNKGLNFELMDKIAESIEVELPQMIEEARVERKKRETIVQDWFDRWSQ